MERVECGLLFFAIENVGLPWIAGVFGLYPEPRRGRTSETVRAVSAKSEQSRGSGATAATDES